MIIALALTIQNSSVFGVEPAWELLAHDGFHYGYSEFELTKDGSWPVDLPANYAPNYWATFNDTGFFDENNKTNCGLSAARFSIACSEGDFLRLSSAVEFRSKEINALPENIKVALANFYKIDPNTTDLHEALTQTSGVKNIFITACSFERPAFYESSGLSELTMGLKDSEFIIMPHGIGAHVEKDGKNYTGSLILNIFNCHAVRPRSGVREGQFTINNFTAALAGKRHLNSSPIFSMGINEINGMPSSYSSLHSQKKETPVSTYHYVPYSRYSARTSVYKDFDIPVFTYGGAPLVFSIDDINEFASCYILGITEDKENIVITHVLLLNDDFSRKVTGHVKAGRVAGIISTRLWSFREKLGGLTKYAADFKSSPLDDAIYALKTLSGNADRLTSPVHSDSSTTTTTTVSAQKPK